MASDLSSRGEWLKWLFGIIPGIRPAWGLLCQSKVILLKGKKSKVMYVQLTVCWQCQAWQKFLMPEAKRARRMGKPGDVITLRHGKHKLLFKRYLVNGTRNYIKTFCISPGDVQNLLAIKLKSSVIVRLLLEAAMKIAEELFTKQAIKW